MCQVTVMIEDHEAKEFNRTRAERSGKRRPDTVNRPARAHPPLTAAEIARRKQTLAEL
jgi:hypothetical protein